MFSADLDKVVKRVSIQIHTRAVESRAIEGRKRNVRPFSSILIAVPWEFISVRMRKKEKKETRTACEMHSSLQKFTAINGPSYEQRISRPSRSLLLSLSLSLVGSAPFRGGLIDSNNCRSIARFRVPACPPFSPWLARSFLGSFFRGDFYRVNEVPASFYNRHGRSPDDDSNNCRAYGRSIGRFPSEVASAIFHGEFNGRAARTSLSPDEYGNPWVTMIIIVRPYLHPNGVAERLLRARRAGYVRRFLLRKGRTSVPARFVGDNNDFSFTTGVSTRDVL